MEERKRYIMKFDIPFYGAIYTVGVTHFEETPPNHNADNDIDYYGEVDCEYEVLAEQKIDETSYPDEEFPESFDYLLEDREFYEAVLMQIFREFERRNLP